jgi:Fe-S cluster assembly protein SufD
MNVLLNEQNISAEIAQSIESRLTAGSPLSALRQEALENFRRLGLPAQKAEEYKDTPITRMLSKNFTFQGTSAETNVDPLPFALPLLAANVIVVINGVFSKTHSKVLSPESELTLVPLQQAVNENHPEVERHLGKYADAKNDALTAWNTAAWEDGFFLHVKDNKVVDRPVIIYYINDTAHGEVITVSRNLIISGANSKATVIEKFDSVGQGNHFSNIVTEGVVAENAELNLYSIQHDEGNRFLYNLIELYQANYSRVNTFTMTMSGKLIRNNLHLVLDGEGIESHMYGLYLLGSDTLADNHTIADHRKPNSFSNEMYKGIMDDSSKGVFNGKIYVRPQAQKTNAFQSNRNILLTDKATVNTKPQLEIWADDVKCSHGCTTGQIDEEALFYLQSRGISKDSARAMMLYAFAGEILDNVTQPELKTYLDQLISERLHKNPWL